MAGCMTNDAVIAILDPSNAGKQVQPAASTPSAQYAPMHAAWADHCGTTRDTHLELRGQAKGTIGANSWSVEDRHTVRGSRPDATPRRCLAGAHWRIAKARKETTSWNPSNRGFHDPYAPRTPGFQRAGRFPAVVMATPEALQPGAEHRNRGVHHS